jgi:hypothetical protein
VFKRSRVERAKRSRRVTFAKLAKDATQWARSVFPLLASPRKDLLCSGEPQLLDLRVEALAIFRCACIAANHGSSMHWIYATKKAPSDQCDFIGKWRGSF